VSPRKLKKALQALYVKNNVYFRLSDTTTTTTITTTTTTTTTLLHKRKSL
jgi:hypothetical protein